MLRRLLTSKPLNLTGYVVTYTLTGDGGSDTVKVVSDHGGNYIDVISLYGSQYTIRRSTITHKTKDSTGFDKLAKEFQMYMF